MTEIKQSVLNIETLGHIDHGKTTLTNALTGVWTDRHSESIKRNMTIKLGYADAIIRKCPHCTGASAYTVAGKCPSCGAIPEPLMRVSLLDAPGHETLMATAITGASIIDAVLFVIAANEPCPMQQTKEHLMIINLLGIRNVIIVQTKIDIVGKEKAMEHYGQIKKFISGSTIEGAPVIPVISNRNINIDVLLERMSQLEVPKRDTESDPIMYVVRSFDVNKPGARISGLVGGVIGGAIIKGRFRAGDEIEIHPGISISQQSKETYKPAVTKIVGMNNGTDQMEEATCGGLIGISTGIDPSFVKADSLVGNVVGHVGKLPQAVRQVSVKYTRIARGDISEQGMREGEPLILGIGTATVVGYIIKAKKDNLQVGLNRPVCTGAAMKIAVLRNIEKRWRLTGYAVLKQ